MRSTLPMRGQPPDPIAKARWLSRCRQILSLSLCLVASSATAQVQNPFGPPGLTSWVPQGCSVVGATDPLLGDRTGWSNLHADSQNSDELSIALAPAWQPGWLAETEVLTATGPIFDGAGNLYFSPLRPHEAVVLISLDPTDGSRRFAIPSTGSSSGGSVPLILEDPGSPGDQIVYLAVYDRAIAVRTDGTTVWDVPTGLSVAPGLEDLAPPVFGLQYVPAFDALFGVSSDGFVFGLDRATGAQRMAAPFSLPGAPSPPVPPPALPQSMLDAVEADIRVFLDLPPELTASDVVSILLGGGVEVANQLATDPASGRLWIAATAPDGDDGSVDGVSELGALYAYDVGDGAGTLSLSKACRRTLAGGSASSPALRGDGERVYIADAVGGVFALDASCGEL